MASSYNRLWKKRIDYGFSETDMKQQYPCFKGQYGKKSVLDCTIGNVMEFVSNKENGGENA